MKRNVWTLRYALEASAAMGALVLVSPILLAAVIGISLSSPGPVIYKARRIARDRRRPNQDVDDRMPDRRQPGYRGREFTLYKLRTMHVATSSNGSPITGYADPRVFKFGSFLRSTKIDELPQLLNIIRGDMALVGPRPEAPEIVRQHYRPDDLQTLQVRPGLTSPGSLYYYLDGEEALQGGDVTTIYAEQVLPIKLQIDRDYVHKATVWTDARLIGRTLTIIVGRLFKTNVRSTH